MAPILARCDDERLPAYLESSKEQNIPFYERHGFRVQQELEIAGGPTLWAMVREVREVREVPEPKGLNPETEPAD